MNKLLFWFLWAAGCLLVAGCGASQATPGPGGENVAQMQLSSSAFQERAPIPKRYTCDGEDLSPPLSWDSAPQGTQSLALIMDDPDAPMGTWDHWVVFDLQAGLTGLPEGVKQYAGAGGSGVSGKNSWSRNGYGGPCPPRGSTHRYFFKIYALDTVLGLKSGASKGEVEKAMRGHILAQGQLIGTYQRGN
jgi:hypothetical protein